MSKARISLIQAAFNKMDKTGDGFITPEDLKGVYNVRYAKKTITYFSIRNLDEDSEHVCRHHPKFLNGEKSEDQIFQEFLRTFDSPNGDGKVSIQSFITVLFDTFRTAIFKGSYIITCVMTTWRSTELA